VIESEVNDCGPNFTSISSTALVPYQDGSAFFIDRTGSKRHRGGEKVTTGGGRFHANKNISIVKLPKRDEAEDEEEEDEDDVPLKDQRKLRRQRANHREQ